MIGNEQEAPDVLRDKMVMDQVEELRNLLEERGVGKVINYASDMIVNLRIELAKAQFVKPTKLDPGTKPDLGVHRKDGVRG